MDWLTYAVCFVSDHRLYLISDQYILTGGSCRFASLSKNLSAKVNYKVSLSEDNEDIKTDHKSQTNTQTPDIDPFLSKKFKKVHKENVLLVVYLDTFSF